MCRYVAQAVRGHQRLPPTLIRQLIDRECHVIHTTPWRKDRGWRARNADASCVFSEGREGRRFFLEWGGGRGREVGITQLRIHSLIRFYSANVPLDGTRPTVGGRHLLPRTRFTISQGVSAHVIWLRETHKRLRSGLICVDSELQSPSHTPFKRAVSKYMGMVESNRDQEYIILEQQMTPYI